MMRILYASNLSSHELNGIRKVPLLRTWWSDQIGILNKKNTKKGNKVRSSFRKSTSSVNGEIWIKTYGEVNYYYAVILDIEPSFNLIYYNSYFHSQIKSCNSLKLQPQLIPCFCFESWNYSSFLVSFLKNIERLNTKKKRTSKRYREFK